MSWTMERRRRLPRLGQRRQEREGRTLGPPWIQTVIAHPIATTHLRQDRKYLQGGTMERQSVPLTDDLGEAMERRQGTRAKSSNPVDLAAGMVGEKLSSAAEALRGTLPQEGRLGGAARAVTDRLESSGSYLQEQGLMVAIDELESLIRRYPVQALLFGAGLGYALSRLRGR